MEAPDIKASQLSCIAHSHWLGLTRMREELVDNNPSDASFSVRNYWAVRVQRFAKFWRCSLVSRLNFVLVRLVDRWNTAIHGSAQVPVIQ